MLNFQGVGSNPRLQETQKDQQMNSLFKAVTPSPGSGGLLRVGLGRKENPNGSKMEACWSFVAADRMILLMREDKPQGSQSGTWVTSHLLLPRLASWACDLYSHTWPCAQKGLVLGLILCCHYLEILNNFIFELVFCKKSLQGNAWVEKICRLHVSTILAALQCWQYPNSTEFQWELGETQSK